LPEEEDEESAEESKDSEEGSKSLRFRMERRTAAAISMATACPRSRRSRVSRWSLRTWRTSTGLDLAGRWRGRSRRWEGWLKLLAELAAERSEPELSEPSSLGVSEVPDSPEAEG
jgi:hypothetical protein